MQSSESQSLPLNVSGVRKFSNWRSIRSKIVAIALGLIVLMIVTSILSMLMSKKVGVLLDELTYRYIPAYSHLASAVRGLQSYGRTVAPESAHQRNFWSVHRSEDR